MLDVTERVVLSTELTAYQRPVLGTPIRCLLQKYIVLYV